MDINSILKDYSNPDFSIGGIKKDKSGFFDLPKDKTCKHPEHKPPMHIYIPQGKGYRHVCPACGAESVIIPPQITL